MTAASTTSQRDDRIPWAAMAGIIATVTVFAVAQGLTYPAAELHPGSAKEQPLV